MPTMLKPHKLGVCLFSDYQAVKRQLWQRWQVETETERVDADIVAVMTDAAEYTTDEHIMKAIAFIIGWNAHLAEGK